MIEPSRSQELFAYLARYPARHSRCDQVLQDRTGFEHAAWRGHWPTCFALVQAGAQPCGDLNVVFGKRSMRELDFRASMAIHQPHGMERALLRGFDAVTAECVHPAAPQRPRVAEVMLRSILIPGVAEVVREFRDHPTLIEEFRPSKQTYQRATERAVLFVADWMRARMPLNSAVMFLLQCLLRPEPSTEDGDRASTDSRFSGSFIDVASTRNYCRDAGSLDHFGLVGGFEALIQLLQTPGREEAARLVPLKCVAKLTKLFLDVGMGTYTRRF